MMKRSAAYFLLLLSALLWTACGGTSQSSDDEEETTETEATAEKEDTPPANPFGESTASEETEDPEGEFYIKVDIGGVEKTFTQTPPDKCFKCSDYQLEDEGRSTLRIERFRGENADESFAIQLYNLDLMEPDSLPLVATPDATYDPPVQTLVLYKNLGSEPKASYEGRNSFTFTIESVENGVYSGSFEGNLTEKTASPTGNLFGTRGTFRIKANVRDKRSTQEEPVS